ncbi:tonin-like [Cephus cinctus]|uniref:Tonin-like n=1 Tax=Cephus cinctus TaxID=211228 RepID=A0AAJ7BWL7_CEPCN|nr:tonin-like [Cephus cinctus]
MSKYIACLLVLLSVSKLSMATILRGTRMKEGQFPWLVQFQTITPCGGVLLAPDWVLTAAECVQYKRNSITLYAAGLNSTDSSQTVSVKATYIFPEYKAYANHPDYGNNVALIKLVQAFDICNENVRLLDIAPLTLDDNYKSCMIFGWQSYIALNDKILAKPVYYSQVFLNSWKLCAYMLRGNASYNNVFCSMVEIKDDMKACAGNPGSPVVCENQFQRMVLVGIATFSNFSLSCDDFPIYLGVNAFRSWMYNVIFNERKSDEGEAELKHSVCDYRKYIGGIFMDHNLQNHTDLVNLDGQPLLLRNISVSKVPEIELKLEPPLPDNYLNDYPRIPVEYGARETMSMGNIAKERDDSLSQYQEIGIKNVFQKTNNITRIVTKSLYDISEHESATSELELAFLIPFEYEEYEKSLGSLNLPFVAQNPILYVMFVLELTLYNS